MTKIGLGIFVKKDINGQDIKVGDIVRVTRPYITFKKNDDEVIELEQQSWTGEVRLLLSMGVVVWSNKRYIKVPFYRSRNKWVWELLVPHSNT